MSEPIKDVHTEHCCVLHGCKYGQDPFCTVVTRKSDQSFLCEQCEEDGIENLTMLTNVMEGKQKRCPHCCHVLP